MDRQKRDSRWYTERVVAVLILGSLLALTIAVTGKDDASNTENALWTFILFSIGAGLSYYFGKQSVTRAAEELVRPQAKAAARRLVTLGTGLNSIREDLNHHRDVARDAATESAEVSVERMEIMVQTAHIHLELQKQMVVDALDDWRQFDPEMANELMEEDGRRTH